MNDTELTARMSPLERRIKARWPRLTDADIEMAGGHIDQLCARIRDRYAISDAGARRQFAQFAEQLVTPVTSDTVPLSHTATAAGGTGAETSPAHGPGSQVPPVGPCDLAGGSQAVSQPVTENNS